jgi:hypothetical protein
MTQNNKDAVVTVIRSVAGGLMAVGIMGIINSQTIGIVLLGAGLFLVAVQARISGDN